MRASARLGALTARIGASAARIGASTARIGAVSVQIARRSLRTRLALLVSMPRKQRFKPSRKPKPIPQTEEAMNGATPQSAQVHNDNASPRAPSGMREDVRDDDSLVEPDPDQQSR